MFKIRELRLRDHGLQEVGYDRYISRSAIESVVIKENMGVIVTGKESFLVSRDRAIEIVKMLDTVQLMAEEQK